MRNVGLVGLGMWLVLMAGCGGSPVGTVSGTVLIDGEPLNSGVISYVPADANGAPITVNVVEGKYRLETTVGRKWVQISAPIVVGKRKEYNGLNAPLVEITEERLGPQYNSDTTLTFEVVPGANIKDWEVQSMNAGEQKPRGR